MTIAFAAGDIVDLPAPATEAAALVCTSVGRCESDWLRWCLSGGARWPAGGARAFPSTLTSTQPSEIEFGRRFDDEGGCWG